MLTTSARKPVENVNMKKVIGEAMYKSQRGEKLDPKDDDMGLSMT